MNALKPMIWAFLLILTLWGVASGLESGVPAGTITAKIMDFSQNKSVSAWGYRGGGVSAHFYGTPVKLPTGEIIELRGEYYLYKGDDVLLKRRFSLLNFEYAYE